MKKLFRWFVVTVVCAQEPPNSYLSFSFGAGAPTGTFAQSQLSFPLHGYAQPGLIIGGQLQTFVAPYIALGINVQYLRLAMKVDDLGKEDHLFDTQAKIAKTPAYNMFLGGFGVGTGIRFNAFTFYVPVYLAFANVSIPEIRGDLDASGKGDYWLQEKVNKLALGVSTGALVGIMLTDDLGASVNILYHGLGSSDVTFTQRRYDNKGTLKDTRTFTRPIRPQIAEVSIGLQYYF